MNVVFESVVMVRLEAFRTTSETTAARSIVPAARNAMSALRWQKTRSAARKCSAKLRYAGPGLGLRVPLQNEAERPHVNDESKFHCEGDVLEHDPPRVLAYTWIANWHEDKARRTVVRWELTPIGGGTRLKVTHTGLAEEQVARRDYSGGWPGVIDQLRKFVEK